MAGYRVGDTPPVTFMARLDDGTPLGTLTDSVTVTMTVTPPGGVASVLTVAHPSVGVFVGAPVLTAAGEWLVVVTCTGAVQDVTEVRLWASATSGPPAWAPTLRQVGSFIPSRTRRVSLDNEPLGTFSDATHPTGEQVGSLIGSACTVVAAALGDPVAPGAYDVAGVAAALLAAYHVELAFPERDADVAVYEALNAQHQSVLASAVRLNEALGGGATVDPDQTAHLLPTHSFPAAPAWADAPFL